MQAGAEQAPAWPPAYGQRRRHQAPNGPVPAHAAASLRAHAALTGEPWLGDAMSAGRAAQCPALPDPALLALQNPFAGSAPGAHGAQPLPEDYLSILQAQQAHQANSEFQEYLNTLPGQGTAWGGDNGAGPAHMGSNKAEGMCYAPYSASCCSVRTVPRSRLCMPQRLPAVATEPSKLKTPAQGCVIEGPGQPCKAYANHLRHACRCRHNGACDRATHV